MDLGNGQEEAKQKELLDSTIESILPRVEDFTRLLTDPPVKPPVKSTAGILDPPLGQTRLHVAKLINSLLATRSLDVNKKLVETKTLDTLLDLFFKYSLNNFLHTQVAECVNQVFEWSGLTNTTSANNDANEEEVEKMEEGAKTDVGQEQQQQQQLDNPLLDHVSPFLWSLIDKFNVQ